MMARSASSRSLTRTVLFWVHLACGIAAGLIILVMSATGVALTYEKQLLSWADQRSLPSTIEPAGTALPVDSLVGLAELATPGKRATAVIVSSAPTAPVKVAFGREGALLLDPYRGTVLGSGDQAMRASLSTITAWHRWLGATDEGRDTAKAITGASNLAFLVLVLTGAILWFPRRLTWVQLRAVLWFRRWSTGKARDFNWHNVLGIWSFVPLVFIVASGVVISYRWAGDLVFRAVGEAPPPRSPAPPAEAPRGGTAGGAVGGRAEASSTAGSPGTPNASAPPAIDFAALIARASTRVPDWRTINIPLPVSASRPVALAIDRGNGGQPQRRGTLTINVATGTEESWAPFASLSAGRRARSFLRFAHTGEYFGVLGQTIAGLATLATVILVWTGVALAWRRMLGALRRQRPLPASNR